VRKLFVVIMLMCVVVAQASDQRIHSKYKRGIFTHIHGIDDTSRVTFKNLAYIGQKSDSLMFYDAASGDTISLSQLRPGGSWLEPDSMHIVGDDSLRIYIDSLSVDLPLFGTVTSKWLTEISSFWLWEDGAYIRTAASSSADTLQKQWVWRWVYGTDSTDVSSRKVATYTLADGFGLDGVLKVNGDIYRYQYKVDTTEVTTVNALIDSSSALRTALNAKPDSSYAWFKWIKDAASAIHSADVEDTLVIELDYGLTYNAASATTHDYLGIRIDTLLIAKVSALNDTASALRADLATKAALDDSTAALRTDLQQTFRLLTDNDGVPGSVPMTDVDSLTFKDDGTTDITLTGTTKHPTITYTVDTTSTVSSKAYLSKTIADSLADTTYVKVWYDLTVSWTTGGPMNATSGNDWYTVESYSDASLYVRTPQANSGSLFNFKLMYTIMLPQNYESVDTLRLFVRGYTYSLLGSPTRNSVEINVYEPDEDNRGITDIAYTDSVTFSTGTSLGSLADYEIKVNGSSLVAGDRVRVMLNHRLQGTPSSLYGTIYGLWSKFYIRSHG